jgi:hypothetical protein
LAVSELVAAVVVAIVVPARPIDRHSGRSPAHHLPMTHLKLGPPHRLPSFHLVQLIRSGSGERVHLVARAVLVLNGGEFRVDGKVHRVHVARVAIAMALTHRVVRAKQVRVVRVVETVRTGSHRIVHHVLNRTSPNQNVTLASASCCAGADDR